MSNDPLFQAAYLSFQRGQMDVAVAQCDALLTIAPGHLNGLQLLAHLRFAAGRFDEAAVLLIRASTVQPGNAVILSNLGAAYCAAGRFAEAVEPLRDSLRVDAKRADSWKFLGRAMQKLGHAGDAVTAYENALALNPSHADALIEVATIYNTLGRLDDAIAALKRALKISPLHPEALNNLAGSLQEAGQLNESIASFRQSLASRPDHRVHSNLIMALHLVDDDLASARLEIARWNDIYAKPIQRFPSPFKNNRSAGRRLRIGYVSRDFNLSPVGRFLAPILTHHDRDAFDVFAYSDSSVDDAMSRRNRAAVDHWRSTHLMSDDAFAEQIRSDAIDVLIDLGLHTTGSRLSVFSRKPAPVQLSYLAYAGSTGLAAIDAEISDGYLSATGPARVTSYWCYETPAEAPDVKPRSAGPITFGCLNNFCKITTATRAAWVEIMHRVPDARLIVHALPGSHRQAFPIDLRRVTFVDRMSPAEYFAMYNAIDIALDPFPYAGGTTTCDALWMGTPVISVAGNTPVGRAGVSILSNAGLPESIADSRADYVERAIALASDRDRLNQYHTTIRSRMQASSLMDAARAARNIEAVYRAMWTKFCGRESA